MCNVAAVGSTPLWSYLAQYPVRLRSRARSSLYCSRCWARLHGAGPKFLACQFYSSTLLFFLPLSSFFLPSFPLFLFFYVFFFPFFHIYLDWGRSIVSLLPFQLPFRSAFLFGVSFYFLSLSLPRCAAQVCLHLLSQKISSSTGTNLHSRWKVRQGGRSDCCQLNPPFKPEDNFECIQNCPIRFRLKSRP